MTERKKWKDKMIRCVLAAAIFFVITMPFRKLFALTDVTEVRPAGALPPVFGLLFGVPGALGCAIGNLGADILSGYSFSICLFGFPVQFLYGLIPYLLWYGAEKNKNEDPVSLSNVRNVLKYIGIVFLDSFFAAAMLGLMLQLLHSGSLISQPTLLLFFNNLVFSLILGIPLIIFASMMKKENRKKVLTLTVRFVLIFLLLSVVSSAMMGISSYGELYSYVEDPVALWNRVYTRVGIHFFVLCGLSICFLEYLEKNTTVPIEKLAEIARNYADKKKLQKKGKKGKINSREMMAQCEILSHIHGEPGYLASAFRKMMQDVEYYIEDVTRITTEKERIRTELTVAAHIQEDMLPDSGTLLTDRQEFILRARMTPAKEVGGDFYDFFLLDDDHLAFLVADVSGKGVPAALFMVVSKTLLRNWAGNAVSVEQVFTNTNRDLCRENKNGMFVTAWMGVLTLSTGELACVNAGHTRPLLRRADGNYNYVTGQNGFVLAGIEDIEYQKEEIQLNPGDTLFLYTDGVTEATDKENQLYGENRLEAVLNKNTAAAPDEILTAVWEDVTVFKGEAEQFDDITMLSLRFNGKKWKEKKGAADIARLPELFKWLDELLETENFSQADSNTIHMAVDEIYSNICHYSKASQAVVRGRVTHLKNGEPEVIISFEDDGIPFNLLKKPDPDVTGDIQSRKTGGLGIYLVKKQMDRISYQYIDGKNRLTIQKRGRESNRQQEEEFINRVGKYAAKDWQERHICLPSLIIAMAIEESDWGRAPDTLRKKELFPGRPEQGKENGASFKQSIFLQNNYLFTWSEDGEHSNWKNLIGQENYILAVQYLQNAVHPYQARRDYEERLVYLIETYNLTRFDSIKK